MVEAQDSSVASDIFYATFPLQKGVLPKLAKGAVAFAPCLLGRKRISCGLSLRWRAIIGLKLKIAAL